MRAWYVINVSLIMKLLRYKIVYGNLDIYVLRKIKKKDRVRGQELRIYEVLNYLYN